MKAPLSARSARPLTDLPFSLDLRRGAETALHAQLAQQLRQAALSGRLPGGAHLPGSRTLAQQLGVARGVVVDAYAELLADGTLEAVVGSATRVAGGLLAGPRSAASGAPAWWPEVELKPLSAPGALHFELGQPTLSLLDNRAWRSCWNAVARQVPPSDYGDPAGDARLRGALAAFVGRTRGHHLSAEQLIVTSSAAQSFGLLASLLPPGACVAVEDPGYPQVYQVFERARLKVQPCPVDADGLQVAALNPAARLIYVTPSHQYPLGVRMSLPRRLELLAWAKQHDALILEDDYDGEFRYDAPPLPALASLDEAEGGRRVIYLGTLSKVLTPSLRLGYLGVPTPLVQAVVQAKRFSDLGSPWAVQQAAANFVLGGYLDQHLRRVRRHYAAQRSALGTLLQPLAPYAVLGGIEAGLHACLHLAAPLKAGVLQDVLRRRGVEVATLGEYSRTSEAQALLLGYGGLSRADLERGAALIAEVIHEQVQKAAAG